MYLISFCIDTHGHTSTLPRIPDGDVLVHTGDFTKFSHSEDIENFRSFLAETSHPHKVSILTFRVTFLVISISAYRS